MSHNPLVSILTTLREMHIPEYAKHEREIKVKYSKRNLCIAAESRDKVRLKIEFQVSKELRALDFRTRLVYLEGRSRVVSFVFQVMRKIKHMITQGERGNDNNY